MAKFIASDPRQPLLLPVDLREWVPSDDLPHFVLAAVERVSLDRFRINERGSGSVRISLKVTDCSAGKLPLVPGKVTTRSERSDAVMTL